MAIRCVPWVEITPAYDSTFCDVSNLLSAVDEKSSPFLTDYRGLPDIPRCSNRWTKWQVSALGIEVG